MIRYTLDTGGGLPWIWSIRVIVLLAWQLQCGIFVDMRLYKCIDMQFTTHSPYLMSLLQWFLLIGLMQNHLEWLKDSRHVGLVFCLLLHCFGDRYLAAPCSSE